jgi:hypothetical protein
VWASSELKAMSNPVLNKFAATAQYTFSYFQRAENLEWLQDPGAPATQMRANLEHNYPTLAACVPDGVQVLSSWPHPQEKGKCSQDSHFTAQETTAQDD